MISYTPLEPMVSSTAFSVAHSMTPMGLYQTVVVLFFVSLFVIAAIMKIVYANLLYFVLVQTGYYNGKFVGTDLAKWDQAQEEINDRYKQVYFGLVIMVALMSLFVAINKTVTSDVVTGFLQRIV